MASTLKAVVSTRMGREGLDRGSYSACHWDEVSGTRSMLILTIAEHGREFDARLGGCGPNIR